MPTEENADSSCPFENADSSSVFKVKMYRVEKFIPGQCPKCGNKFGNNRKDYCQSYFETCDEKDGKKVYRDTKGYDVIVCLKCANLTARFPLLREARVVRDLEEAQKWLDEGFTSITEVWASENFPEGYHVIDGIAHCSGPA